MTTRHKIKIVYENIASFNSDWLIPLVNEYFELAEYDRNDTYDKNATIFYTNVMGEQTHVFKKFYSEGYKIIIDNFWEAKSDKNFEKIQLIDNPNVLILHNVNWFWYNESLWYQHLGYDKYIPSRTYTKTALMPMRLRNFYRTALKQKLENYLDDFVWSYVAEGRELPNGGDAVNDWNVQRLFRPEWYDQTCFSIVAESFVPPECQEIFITEKTFKPIAFRHPFMIVSNPGTLTYLKSQGFETFDNLFDERYDSESHYLKRIECIVKNVENFQKQPLSQIILDKIQHNYTRFFDTELVKQRIVNEIFEPIIEHAET